MFRKIPGGIFGREGEMHLFTAVELPQEQQVDAIRRYIYLYRFLYIIFCYPKRPILMVFSVIVTDQHGSKVQCMKVYTLIYENLLFVINMSGRSLNWLKFHLCPKHDLDFE